MGNSNHKKLSRARVKGPTMGQAVAGWLPNSRTHSGVRERTDLSGLFFASNNPIYNQAKHWFSSFMGRGVRTGISPVRG